jgi:hypothetical protein
MSVARLCVLSPLLFLTLVVSLSGQQKPAAAPTGAASRATGNLAHGR